MQEIDTLIIGSGAAGLSAAICLSRAGQKVLVLEQHYVPGGWCHSFFLNGQRFSPGVHYIGMIEKGESTAELYEGLGIANDLTFFRMNPKGYEHVHIGDNKFEMPAGKDNLYESLAVRFPHEKKGLKKYLDMVHAVSQQLQFIVKMRGFWDNLTVPYRTRYLGKYGLFSLKKVINWFVKDPLLQKVLNSQCGDHGLPPAMASFPLHCAVMDHYFNGGYYPMGGGAGIVKAMTKAITRNGGEVRVKQKVKRILLEQSGKNKRAVGVELESGEVIKAKRIISNADPNKTFLGMVGEENLSEKLRKRISKTRYSVTSLLFFLTVDMDVRAAGMDSGNIWMLKDLDVDEIYKKMTAADILSDDEFPGLFISCPTLKDPPSFNGRYHNIEVVTFIDYEVFKKFSGEGGNQTPEYLAMKKRISEKMLNSLEKILPGIREKVVQMDLGTPITNEYYINSTGGNAYGTEKTFNQSGPFSFPAKSEIENLYLCGASILAHGVAGAANSGVKTAATILKCHASDLLKHDASQNITIFDAEDSSEWSEHIRQKVKDKKARFKEVEVGA
ncbi:MAG: NAD(P)/FAD-dependent oxidoreductase [Bacteroidetes bacterium]|nr:NAD(P)/FAD-dependent oxidoreductase [Bacteroidota bacterium]